MARPVEVARPCATGMRGLRSVLADGGLAI